MTAGQGPSASDAAPHWHTQRRGVGESPRRPNRPSRAMRGAHLKIAWE